MHRRKFFGVLTGALSLPLPARAESSNVPEIGWLSSVSSSASQAFLGAFRHGLRDQGFIEGSFTINERYAEGRYDNLGQLANDLVQRKVALIVASGGVVSARAAENATSQIPILFVSGFDPVLLGLVDRFNEPGGNATGINLYTSELTNKRLQYLRDVVPLAKSIAFLVNGDPKVKEIEKKDATMASERLGVNVIPFDVSTEKEIEQAFAAVKDKIGGFIVSADPFLTSQRKQIVDLAARYSLPGCYPWVEYVDAGGLLSYGPDLIWAYRHVLGAYAGKILKGAKVSDLSVVLPTTYKLVINKTAAKSLGLNLSQSLLALADQVKE